MTALKIGKRGWCKGCSSEVSVEDFYDAEGLDPIHIVPRPVHACGGDPERCAKRCPDIEPDPCGPIVPL